MSRLAWVDVFGKPNYHTSSLPAFVYYNNFGSFDQVPDFIAEAVSHELGHNMGLAHDARNADGSYYGGHSGGGV